jgi:predicted amidohydrolase
MPKQPLHLDLIPIDLAWGNPRENLSRIESAIERRLKETPSISPQERLFVFPETALTGFVTEKSHEAALDRNGPELEQARQIAKKHSVGLIVGFPEKSGQARPFNTLLVISPEGRDLADYQKIHLYTVGKPSESESYERGSTGTIFSYRGWKIALAICFDLRFSGLFLSYAHEGADLVILPSCWIGGTGKSYQFKTLSAARSIEGQFFFAALNRSGKDPFASYEGEALCFGPKGEALSDAGGFRLDPALLEEARKLQVRPSDLEEYPVLTAGTDPA